MVECFKEQKLKKLFVYFFALKENHILFLKAGINNNIQFHFNGLLMPLVTDREKEQGIKNGKQKQKY